MISAHLKGTLRGSCRKGLGAEGFTLMEVMVAVAVVAIALMAIYRMHTQTLFMDVRSRFDTVAALLARQKLADIDAGDLTELTSDSGDFSDTHPGFTWQIESETVETDLLEEDGPTIKRIHVTIRANEGQDEFKVTTYRYLYE